MPVRTNTHIPAPVTGCPQPVHTTARRWFRASYNDDESMSYHDKGANSNDSRASYITDLESGQGDGGTKGVVYSCVLATLYSPSTSAYMLAQPPLTSVHPLTDKFNTLNRCHLLTPYLCAPTHTTTSRGSGPLLIRLQANLLSVGQISGLPFSVYYR